MLETQGGVPSKCPVPSPCLSLMGLRKWFSFLECKALQADVSKENVTAQKKKIRNPTKGFKCRAGGRPGFTKTQKGPAPREGGSVDWSGFPEGSLVTLCCKSVIVPALQRRQSTSRNLSSQLLCLCRKKSLQGCTIYNCSTQSHVNIQLLKIDCVCTCVCMCMHEPIYVCVKARSQRQVSS